MSSLSSHPLLSSASDFRGAGILVVRPAACGRRSAPGASLGRKLSGARRAYCCLPEVVQVRRFCPILEGETFQNKKELGFVEWQAVPDIWKSSAEKYGDRIALIDRYHDPPSEFTYKQLEQEILFFSEGLRVLGVNPEEKVAIFADNSCRCLVADQGIMAIGAINVTRGTRSSEEELLQIYRHSERVFGCVTFVLDFITGRDKLAPRVVKCAFLGYQCLDLVSSRHSVLAGVTFHESIAYFSTVGHNLPMEMTRAPMPVPSIAIEELPIATPPATTTTPKYSDPIVTYRRPHTTLQISPFTDTFLPCSGETVEPSVLEEAALRSSLIQQIVVIGQGQRRLGALIFPNKGELLATAKTYSLVPYDASEIETRVVMKLLSDELTNWTSGCSFKIGPILIVDEPFTIDDGLMTPTMKVSRDRVAAKYSNQIANLFK